MNSCVILNFLVYFLYKRRLHFIAFNPYLSNSLWSTSGKETLYNSKVIVHYCRTMVPSSFLNIEILFQVLLSLHYSWHVHIMHSATYTFSSPVFNTKSLSLNVKAINKNLWKMALQFAEPLFLLNSQAIVLFNTAPLSYIVSSFAALRNPSVLTIDNVSYKLLVYISQIKKQFLWCHEC